MPGVFLSYRREDSSGYAGRLFDILSAQFGKENVYMDLDTIEGGDDFSAVIEKKINLADALVAVIGNQWLTITGKDGRRRLDGADDFVRSEIAMALERGIRVIPVLVGNAMMPCADELPGNLRPLCERQAIEIRDRNFHPDAERLTDVLHKELRVTTIAEKPPVDVAGKWSATVKYDWGDTYEQIFEFEVEGSEISGMAGYLADKDGDGRTIMDGKIAGNRISFTTKTWITAGRNQPNVEESHFYNGTVEGDSILFTLRTADTPISWHRRVQFTAHRVKLDPAK
jgi:hypothetical protein